MAGNNTNILLEILGSFDTGKFNCYSVHETYLLKLLYDLFFTKQLRISSNKFALDFKCLQCVIVCLDFC